MDQSVKQTSPRDYRGMQEKAKKLLQQTDVEKLPSLPHVLLPLLKICQSETLAYGDLLELLNKDPALYMKMLCLGQHSSDPQTPTSQTVMVLLQGVDSNLIKGLASSASVSQFFSRNDSERIEFNKQHWKHSLLCACIAELLAEHTGYYDASEAYTAGLLHDIGQLVLENAYPDKYTSTFAQLSEDDFFHNLECDEFSTTHQHVGAELILKHTGNRFLADAILYHHEATDKLLDAHPLVKIINLANQISSSNFSTEDHDVFNNAEVLLGVDRHLLIEILNTSMERITGYALELEIDLGIDGIDNKTVKKIIANEQLKQVLLAEQVKNIALLDSVHQHLACVHDINQQPEIIEHYLGMLFNISHVIHFIYDTDNNLLRARSSAQSPTLCELSIPMKADRSIVSNSLLNRQPLHTFSEEHNNVSVIDRQITGLTEHDGLICLPMLSNESYVGVLVLGVNEAQQKALWKKLPLLTYFTNEISHTLSSTRVHDNKNLESLGDQSKLLETRIHEVSHEVGNPLSIINNYLEILSCKLDADNPAQTDIGTIKNEINRVHDIIQQLSEPTPSSGEVSLVDINKLLTDLSNIFQTSLLSTHKIQFILELDENIKPLPSNANTLKQIYTNLIKNASEALSAKGKIMVYTQDMVNVDGIEHIEISVTDNGPGIDAKILSNLFSPVSSTKGEDHSGLGLSIVRKLVNELKGSISCRSNSKGTSFHILLPKS